MRVTAETLSRVAPFPGTRDADPQDVARAVNEAIARIEAGDYEDVDDRQPEDPTD